MKNFFQQIFTKSLFYFVPLQRGNCSFGHLCDAFGGNLHSITVIKTVKTSEGKENSGFAAETIK